MNWRTNLTAFALSLACFPLAAQQTFKIGSPLVHLISRQEYHAGPQNWAIDEGPDGTLYFGNNDGLLERRVVNGKEQWTLYPLPNETIVRSIAVHPLTGRIYVGGQGIFGYFDRNKAGYLEFTRLDNRIEEAGLRNFEDVWRIYLQPPSGNSVLFTTYKMVAQYSGGDTVKTFPAGKDSTFEYAFWHEGAIYAFRFNHGLVRLNEKSNNFDTIPGGSRFKNSPVKAILSFSENLKLIPTQYDGVFTLSKDKVEPWLPQLAGFFQKVQINQAAKITGSRYAFATKLNGVLIVDKEGRLVAQINKERGLPNDNVLFIFEDHEGNLWLGLHNGIARVELNDKLRRWNFVSIPPNIQLGAHSAAMSDDSTLYLATTNGVYFKKFGGCERLGREFDTLPGTVGEAWWLEKAGGTLFLGHDQGAYVIEKGKAIKLNTGHLLGFWRFLEAPNQPGFIVAGCYQGLALFRRDPNEPGGWHCDGPVSGIDESCRILEFDEENNLWMTHVYKGVFRLKLSPDLLSVQSIRYGPFEGLPEGALKVNVFKINGKILFGTQKGIFRFDSGANRFYRDKEYAAIFGDDAHISLLVKEPGQEAILYVNNGRPGRLRYENGVFIQDQGVDFSFLDGSFKTNFEFILPLGAGAYLFGAADGFYKYGENPAVPICEELTKVEPPKSCAWPWLLGILLAGLLAGGLLMYFFNKNRQAKPGPPAETDDTSSGLLLLIENAYTRKLVELDAILRSTNNPERLAKLDELRMSLHTFLPGIKLACNQMLLYLQDSRQWVKRLRAEFELKPTHWEVAVCLRDGLTKPEEIKKWVDLKENYIQSIKQELRDKLGVSDYPELENYLRFYLYPFIRNAHRLLEQVENRAADPDSWPAAIQTLLHNRPDFDDQLRQYVGKRTWTRKLTTKHRDLEFAFWPYVICLRNDLKRNLIEILLSVNSNKIDELRARLKRIFGPEADDDLARYVQGF